MPSGRKPEGEHALSNAERQARYRLRHQVGRTGWRIRERGGRSTAVAARGVGTMPSPNCLTLQAELRRLARSVA